jgi:hypothetical protein
LFFEGLDKKKIKPLLLLKEIGQSLGTDLHLDKLVVKSVQYKVLSKHRADPYAYNDPSKTPDVKTVMEAVMTLSFDGRLAPDIGVDKINKLKEDIQGRLPDYDVDIVKQVADLSYTGNFVGEAGVPLNTKDPQNYEAEILVKGPVR